MAAAKKDKPLTKSIWLLCELCHVAKFDISYQDGCNANMIHVRFQHPDYFKTLHADYAISPPVVKIALDAADAVKV